MNLYIYIVLLLVSSIICLKAINGNLKSNRLAAGVCTDKYSTTSVDFIDVTSAANTAACINKEKFVEISGTTTDEKYSYYTYTPSTEAGKPYTFELNSLLEITNPAAPKAKTYLFPWSGTVPAATTLVMGATDNKPDRTCTETTVRFRELIEEKSITRVLPPTTLTNVKNFQSMDEYTNAYDEVKVEITNAAIGTGLRLYRSDTTNFYSMYLHKTNFCYYKCTTAGTSCDVLIYKEMDNKIIKKVTTLNGKANKFEYFAGLTPTTITLTTACPGTSGTATFDYCSKSKFAVFIRKEGEPAVDVLYGYEGYPVAANANVYTKYPANAKVMDPAIQTLLLKDYSFCFNADAITDETKAQSVNYIFINLTLLIIVITLLI